jgi:hypothetical protein
VWPEPPNRRRRMYALVSLWQLPDGPWDELQPQVDQEILSFARQAPGVVAGYWTYERTTSKSVGFILLKTAEQAHYLKSAIESHMMPHRGEAGRATVLAGSGDSTPSSRKPAPGRFNPDCSYRPANLVRVQQCVSQRSRS